MLDKKFFWGITFNVGSSVIARLSTFCATLIMARYLGPSLFGIFGIFMTSITAVSNFCLLGVPQAMHTYVSREWDSNPKRAAEFISTGQILVSIGVVVGASLLFVFSKFIGVYFFHDAQLETWLRMAAFGVALGGIGIFFSTVVAGFQEFKSLGLQTVAISLLTLFVTFFLVREKLLWGAIVANLSSLGMTLCGSFLIVRRTLKNSGIALTFENFKLRGRQIAKFGFPISLAGLLSAPLYFLLQGIVFKRAGFQELGLIRAGQAISGLILFLPGVVSSNFLSALSAAKGREDKEFRDLAVFNARFIWMILLPVTAALSIGMEPLMSMLMGGSFQKASAIGAIMVWSALVYSLYLIAYQFFQTLTKTWFMFLCQVSQPFLFFCMAYFLVPKFSGIGYVVSELLSYIAMLSVTSMILKNDVLSGSRYELQRLAVVTIGLVFLVFPVRHFLHNAVIQMAVGGATGLGVTWWLYRFHASREEREIIIRILTKPL